MRPFAGWAAVALLALLIVGCLWAATTLAVTR
jgi:hypothetical protein